MAELRFDKATDASRYELYDGSDLVSALDYRDDGTTVALVRAFTIPTFRGKGYAAEVTRRAVDEIEEQGDRRVSPVCWYVAEWFDAHPERAHLLAARV